MITLKKQTPSPIILKHPSRPFNLCETNHHTLQHAREIHDPFPLGVENASLESVTFQSGERGCPCPVGRGTWPERLLVRQRGVWGDTALGIPLSPGERRSAIGVTLCSLRGGNVASGEDSTVLRKKRVESCIARSECIIIQRHS